MVFEIIAATGGDDVEVVVSAGPHSARGDERAVERIVGIVQAIHAEDGFQTVFVESLVVGDKWQALNHGLYLFPYVREDGRVLRVFLTEAVDAGATPVVIVGLGMDERVERVDDFSVSHDHHTYGADAGALEVGGLKVYSSKVFHGCWMVVVTTQEPCLFLSPIYY